MCVLVLNVSNAQGWINLLGGRSSGAKRESERESRSPSETNQRCARILLKYSICTYLWLRGSLASQTFESSGAALTSRLFGVTIRRLAGGKFANEPHSPPIEGLLSVLSLGSARDSMNLPLFGSVDRLCRRYW